MMLPERNFITIQIWKLQVLRLVYLPKIQKLMMQENEMSFILNSNNSKILFTKKKVKNLEHMAQPKSQVTTQVTA